MSKFLSEFKQFAMRGNVLDMAVGVIIGGAFGKIVSSLVDDLIMPPIGWIIGGVNFSELKISLPTVEVAGEKLPADLPRLLHRGFLYLHADQTGQQVCQEEGGRAQTRA